MGQEFFARGIAQRLTEFTGVRAMSAPHRTALAHAFAGALFSLLSWWLHGDRALSAEQMDAIYHQIVRGSVALTRPQQSGRVDKLVFQRSTR
jgi:hypothetical protein